MNSSGNLTIALIAEYYLIIIFHLKNFPALPCDKISPHYLYESQVSSSIQLYNHRHFQTTQKSSF